MNGGDDILAEIAEFITGTRNGSKERRWLILTDSRHVGDGGGMRPRVRI